MSTVMCYEVEHQWSSSRPDGWERIRDGKAVVRIVLDVTMCREVLLLSSPSCFANGVLSSSCPRGWARSKMTLGELVLSRLPVCLWIARWSEFVRSGMGPALFEFEFEFVKTT
jgi:hypothetical protein